VADDILHLSKLEARARVYTLIIIRGTSVRAPRPFQPPFRASSKSSKNVILFKRRGSRSAGSPRLPNAAKYCEGLSLLSRLPLNCNYQQCLYIHFPVSSQFPPMLTEPRHQIHSRTRVPILSCYRIYFPISQRFQISKFHDRASSDYQYVTSRNVTPSAGISNSFFRIYSYNGFKHFHSRASAPKEGKAKPQLTA
jgi:hypothetical protein